VLDGADACTTQALLAEGFRAENIFAPNMVPAVADLLRARGVNAWAGNVDAYLRARRPDMPAFRLVYLDHTGSVPRHAGVLRRTLASGAVSPGGIVAATFSTKRGPRKHPRPWSPAHALHAAVGALVHGARSRGLKLEGAAVKDLADYCYQPVSLVGPATCGVRQRDTEHERTIETTIRVIEEALASSDIVGLAQALEAWAKVVDQSGDEPASSARTRLAPVATEHAELSLRLLRANAGASPEVLGAAFGPCEEPSSDLPRKMLRRRAPGAPHAVVGGSRRELPDRLARSLWWLAAGVLGFESRRARGRRHKLETDTCLDLGSDGSAALQKACTLAKGRRHAAGARHGDAADSRGQARVKWFKGSTLLYPANMMFAMFRVEGAAAKSVAESR